MAALGGQYQVIGGPTKIWRVTTGTDVEYPVNAIISDFDQTEEAMVQGLIAQGDLYALSGSTDAVIPASTGGPTDFQQPQTDLNPAQNVDNPQEPFGGNG